MVTFTHREPEEASVELWRSMRRDRIHSGPQSWTSCLLGGQVEGRHLLQKEKSKVRGIQTFTLGCMAMWERGTACHCREPGKRGQLVNHTSAYVR